MSEIVQVEPSILWKHFNDLNAVPRPSKKEERVIEFMQQFGEKLGLETITDEVGNVLIKKAASPGMENRKKIILQSHLDMVHQKNSDTNFDFDSEGIKMFIEDDWVKAEGTTLGADNGIGVATAMAILESSDIVHPPIEALFTIDEETGMTGAFGLKEGFLEGEILLNLDTEDDDELTIGCAGGVNVNGEVGYEEEELTADSMIFYAKISGLSGGHSGMDIHKGLGNANKLMNRFLAKLDAHFEVQIAQINGGGLRNAIPRESEVYFAIGKSNESKCKELAADFEKEVKAEYEVTDPQLEFELSASSYDGKAASVSFSKKVIQSIYALPSGIYRMSPSIEGMVQTSNNLSQVSMKEGKLEILCLCRSSVDSEKYDEVQAIAASMAVLGAKVTTDSDYPGWTPRPQSDIVEVMQQLYVELFNEQPHVMACHAGLECGIIGSNYPNMDMVSFGPNIRGAHSPDEKVQISSVQKYWNFLMETLKRIPEA